MSSLQNHDGGGELAMPKAGFKSITITDVAYDRFQNKYKKNKERLNLKGISSFSGYISYIMALEKRPQIIACPHCEKEICL